MKYLHPSVRQWILSFLVVDAAFWLFLVGGCLVNRVECLESFTFGPYLFYLPVALLFDAIFPAIPALFQTDPAPVTMTMLLEAAGALPILPKPPTTCAALLMINWLKAFW